VAQTITVDLDEIAQARIVKLEKQLTKAESKIGRLERQLSELRRRENQVKDAHAIIDAWTCDLQNNGFGFVDG
jgi:phage shock protein A